jgi:peptide/nickel transport system substrate-binding protein
MPRPAPLARRAARALVAVLLLGVSQVPQRTTAQVAADMTLYYYASQSIGVIGPAQSDVITGLYGAVYDTLFSPDRQDHPQPDLALSVDHSADWRTWTFHLRHGVQWADGQPFTSADVAYTYHAIIDPAHWVINTAGWDHIDRLTTPDASTVVCHLRSTYGPFLSMVGFDNFILPEHLFDRPGVDFNAPPQADLGIGTGPYTIANWDPNTAITLVRNPHSWRGLPTIRQLQIRPEAMYDHPPPFISRSSGLSFQPIPPYLVPGAISDANILLVVALKQFGFLRDTLVRQALDYATPKDTVTSVGAAAYADVDPAMVDFYNPSLPRHPYNLTTAAALLAKDGFSKGPDGILRKAGQPLAIALDTIYSSRTGQALAVALAKSWGQLGIKVMLNIMYPAYGPPGSLFGADGPQYTPGMTAIVEEFSPGDDPDDSYLWNSTAIPKKAGGGGNVVAFFHPFTFQAQIDALTNAGLSTPDPARRRPIYFRIQSLLADEVPWIFVRWLPNQLFMPSNLVGVAPNGFSNLFWNVTTWRIH